MSVRVTEGIAAGSGQIRVTSSSGARVDENGTTLAAGDGHLMSTALGPALPPGIYTAAWSLTSAVDGHYSAGSFAFAVQDANGSIHGVLPGLEAPEEPAPSLAEVALRAGSFLCLAALVGACAVAALVWAPAARRGGKDSQGASLSTLRTLLLWGAGNAGAFAALTLAWFAYALGLSASEGASVSLSTPFALSMVARIGLAGGAGALLLAARRRPTIATRRFDPLLFGAFAGALGAVGATSAAGHAAASGALGGAGVALDALHLGAVTTWVGGLMALVTLRPALVAPHVSDVVAPALQRFSRLATVCVAAVLVGGLWLALLEVETADRLLSTTFGNLVLAKILLFLPIVSLGAWNHFRQVPRLERPSRRAPAVRHILSRVRFEVALGAAVLVLAGLLTATSPAGEPPPGAPEPFVLQQTHGDVRFDFTCSPTPSVPQAYSLQVTLWNASTGAQVEGALNLTVRFSLANGALPPTTLLFEGPHGNHFFADTSVMSQAGTWRLDGRVRMPDGSDSTFMFEVTLQGA